MILLLWDNNYLNIIILYPIIINYPIIIIGVCSINNTVKGWFSLASESKLKSHSAAWQNQSRKNLNCLIFFWLCFVSVAYDKLKLKYRKWNRSQRRTAIHSTPSSASWQGFRFISRLLIPLLTIWISHQFFVLTVLFMTVISILSLIPM